MDRLSDENDVHGSRYSVMNDWFAMSPKNHLNPCRDPLLARSTKSDEETVVAGLMMIADLFYHWEDHQARLPSSHASVGVA
jgi:hypothetical protein